MLPNRSPYVSVARQISRVGFRVSAAACEVALSQRPFGADRRLPRPSRNGDTTVPRWPQGAVPALSDGYRAFLGWVGDLLYHISVTCPPGKKLIDNRGIVMVDEIDLHLHPKWQMTILPTLARELPNIQFIVTSHSPLIVGSLEWMNILLMKAGANQSSEPARVEWAVHGLDADQVLLTDFFRPRNNACRGQEPAVEGTDASRKNRPNGQMIRRSLRPNAIARSGSSMASRPAIRPTQTARDHFGCCIRPAVPMRPPCSTMRPTS